MKRPLTFACTFSLLAGSVFLSLPSPARLLQPIPASAQQELDRLFVEGRQAFQRSDFPAALRALETGLAQAQALHDEKTTARFLNLIGNVHSMLSQFDQALDFYQRALQINEKLGDELDIAKSFNNIGVAYDSLGQLNQALDYYQRALQAFEKLGNDLTIAYSLNNLGVTYETLGQLDRALDFYRRALQINEKLGNEQDIAKSLNNMGIICTGLGQFDQALAYHQRALQINERLGNALDIALSVTGLGDIHYRLGNLDKALDLYQQAFQRKEKVGNEESNAASLTNIGNVYNKLGQYDRALDCYQQALTRREKVGNEQEIAESLYNIGTVYDSLGQFAQARDYYERALTYLEAITRQVTDSASIGALQETFPTFYARYARLLRRKAGSSDAEALAMLERGRAQGLAQRVAQARTDFTALFSAPDTARWKAANDELTLATSLLDAATSRLEQINAETKSTPDQKQAAQKQRDSALIRRETAERELTALRAALMQRYPRFQQLFAPPHPTTQQFKALAQKHPDTLFVEWGVVDDKTLLVFTLDHKWGLRGYEISLDTPALREAIAAYNRANAAMGETVATRFGVSALAQAVEVWRASIEQGRYLSGAQAPIGKEGERLRAVARSEERLANVLYRTLFPPRLMQTRSRGEDYKHLALVGDGPLLNLPFAALMDGQSRLVDRYALSTAVSLHFLLRPPSQKKPANTLLCAADPAGLRPQQFAGLEPGTTAIERAGLGPLDHAREEARSVVTFFPGAVGWAGPQASEAAVKRAMDRYQVLHFATHGVLDGRNGLRSWLALAEATQPFGSKEDGRLEAREVVPMQLAAEMTVLSACESGLGQRSGGEGLLGLAWGFQAAGCPAVVASLWRVNDTATRDLMVAFYAGLKKGQPKDAALREAMRRVRGRGKEAVHAAPFYWAGFQIIGETDALSSLKRP